MSTPVWRVRPDEIGPLMRAKSEGKGRSEKRTSGRCAHAHGAPRRRGSIELFDPHPIDPVEHSAL